jgi:hypothetical protein
MKDIEEEIGKEFRAGGHFYDMRKMNFVEIEAVRAIETIRHIDPQKYNSNEKCKLVLLIWQLPLYALWWRDRCVQMGADRIKFEAYVRELERVVEEKLKGLLS